ncbi:MAG: extracellular solute-binding protein, partial [Acidimicrobiales bacterium]
PDCSNAPPRARSAPARLLTLLLATAVLAAACTGGDDDGGGRDSGLGDPGDCTVVDAAISPEKIDLVTDLARSFNDDDASVDGDRCWFADPVRRSSGAAATLLYEGWDESVSGPPPVIWSPAASTWGAVVNQRLSENGRPAIVPTDFEQFMLTPLVIAMPEPMARALGYPDTPIGWADILQLATSATGWADFGHPEWGPFRLGKTNPNFSTSGLAALIAQTYAATGRREGLTSEDLASQAVIDFATGVESAVVHYGDTTLTFLNNLYAADQRDAALSYVSAVAVEEKSVIDYNLGNPDGILQPGEEPRPPRVPLVAIYPEEGTLFSDNPFFVLDAEWVDDDETEGARRFAEFVGRPENQRRVLEFGFRPANPEVAVGEPITAENLVDPAQPTSVLEVPEPAIMSELLERWETQRKRARVLIVLDVSGSMGDPADLDNPGGPTRLDLAKDAAIAAIDLFAPDDEIALRIFTTDVTQDGTNQTSLDLVDYGRVADVGENVRNRIRDLRPLNGTPLYQVAQDAFETGLDNFDPTRINAVVLLTDGVNDDGNPGDDNRQLQDLLAALEQGSEGQLSRPVRVFTVGYSTDVDQGVLRQISEASAAASYSATDPTSINQVLTAVVSNF